MMMIMTACGPVESSQPIHQATRNNDGRTVEWWTRDGKRYAGVIRIQHMLNERPHSTADHAGSVVSPRTPWSE